MRRCSTLRAAVVAFITAFLAAAASTALAADYPTRPVRIITPFAAGGGIDILTRVVAQRLGQQWSQSVLVENRPGAGATIGYAAAAKAAPDGYTLVLGANPLGISPVIYPNLPYEARRDFAPISLVAATPEVLVVNGASDLHTVADLAAHARKQPRRLNYGSAGSGTLAHLAAESFNRRAAMNAVHIAYKGSAPALTDLLGGAVDWLFDSPAAILPGIQAGSIQPSTVSSLSKLPVQPMDMLPRCLTNSAISAGVAPSTGSHRTVTRVRSNPSEASSTVVSMVSGQSLKNGGRVTFSL